MKLNDAVVGAALLLLAVAVGWHIRGFPQMPGQKFGPAVFPGLIAAGLAACGVLLIVRMVPRERLVALLDCAAEQGLFVLLEAFDADDLDIAEQLARERQGRDEQVLMGLNCRDLETLEIDFERFYQLRSRMPFDWPCVAESGVQAPQDAARVAKLGYRLALVGTSLMRRPDPARAVAELLEAGRGALP